MGLEHCTLSKNDSLVLKGIAICGMLCWHLFYCSNPLGISFDALTTNVAILGDVCVSMFLFVSGYGLSIQFKKLSISELNDKTSIVTSIRFVLRRLFKFYFSFWPVFLIAILFGTFVMKIPYAGSHMQFVKEALGLSSVYNPSWWFNYLIISFYLVFPILYICVENALLPTLLLSLLLTSFKIPHLHDLSHFSFIFTCGIAWALNSERLKHIPLYVDVSIIFISIAYLLYKSHHCSAIYLDCLLGFAFLTLSISHIIVREINCLRPFIHVLAFIGKHATNIYLIHTLIFRYFFPEFFYGLKYPLFIFLALLFISLAFSIVLEFLKEKSGYNKLSSSLTAKFL